MRCGERIPIACEEHIHTVHRGIGRSSEQIRRADAVGAIHFEWRVGTGCSRSGFPYSRPRDGAQSLRDRKTKEITDD
jgi:hypothetical protein